MNQYNYPVESLAAFLIILLVIGLVALIIWIISKIIDKLS